MSMRNIINQFSQTIDSLPAEERAVLDSLAGRMASLSEQELTQAVALGAGRGLTLRTGVCAGGWETEY